MSKLVPDSRPQRSRELIEGIVANHLVTLNKAVLVTIRGYYRDTMGKKGVNDHAMYDDAAFLISPDFFKSYNFNTDPQKAGQKKAKLKAPAKIEYYKGRHKGKYNALRPYPEGVQLPCTRDGVESLCSHTNIHKGGFRDTHSEGCQTVYPTQYDGFIKDVYSQMDKYKQKTIMNILVEE
jgi:hypothetical protein